MTVHTVIRIHGVVGELAGQSSGRRRGVDQTFAIITGPPNELVAPIHDRMPVILPQEVWARWLGEEEADGDQLQSLLKPYPAERMSAYSISTRVNSVKNDDAGLKRAFDGDWLGSRLNGRSGDHGRGEYPTTRPPNRR